MERHVGDFILYFPMLLLSLSFHEASHAWVAHRMGDDTGYLLGRVSLSPIPHIDPIGTLLFPVLGFFTGLPFIGWAKPVPVNPVHLRDVRKGHMLISLAGPGSNLLLAALFLVILKLLLVYADSSIGLLGSLAEPTFKLLQIGLLMNIALAIFNIIPIPPLDGHWVLYHLLPNHAAQVMDQIRPYGFLILYALMLTGVLQYFFLPAYVVVRYFLN
ncbi:MAG: site-2 protease family protein [Acidobacteriota bacterium]|nr:site-2 protease family protein [Blastocatellia bacterium]MDW8239380.1 site-2 protease family protein [Acidobacteriota bacterium]